MFSLGRYGPISATAKAELQAKKEGHRIAPGPYRYEGQKTSRGEQLMRWNWEESHHVHQLSAI